LLSQSTERWQVSSSVRKSSSSSLRACPMATCAMDAGWSGQSRYKVNGILYQKILMKPTGNWIHLDCVHPRIVNWEQCWNNMLNFMLWYFWGYVFCHDLVWGQNLAHCTLHAVAIPLVVSPDVLVSWMSQICFGVSESE
jgi:hypothetical protein